MPQLWIHYEETFKVDTGDCQHAADLKPVIQNTVKPDLDGVPPNRLKLRAPDGIIIDGRTTIAELIARIGTGTITVEISSASSANPAGQKRPSEGEESDAKRRPLTLESAIEKILEGIRLQPQSQTDKAEMPLQDRDLTNPTSIIKDNITHRLNGSVSKADFMILVSGGAPGIGKTRFGQGLYNHLQSHLKVPEWKQPHFEYLYLDFGNGIKLDKYDGDFSAMVIIGLRIAYTFFVDGQYHMPFVNFRDRAMPHAELFKVANVLNYIEDRLRHQNNLQSDQDVFVFLHIDEFQLIDAWDRHIEDVQETLFYNMIGDLAPFILPTKTPKFFVQTFLSGTAPSAVINVKEASRISFKFIPCPLLSMKSRIDIADHFATKYNAPMLGGQYKWKLCKPLLQLLDDTGGLPRALQYLFAVCFNYGGEQLFHSLETQSFNKIFYSTLDRLEGAYNIIKRVKENRRLALELLHHCIDAIPVELDDCLDPNAPKDTIANLERDAHIILSRHKDTPKYIINMPFFFLYTYNYTLGIVPPPLERAFQVDHTMYWQEWELFVAHYEAFRNNLLIRRGFQQLPLEELYRGAYGKKETLETVVGLTNLSVRTSNEQFPKSTNLTDKSNGTKINWKAGDVIVVNGASAEFGDSFLVRNLSDGTEVLISTQDKWDYGAASIKENTWQKEFIKNINSLTESALSNYRVITIVFTTQRLDRNLEDAPNLPDDCLLVTKEKFETYFGPVFSSRATFAIAAAINPNFSDLKRLQTIYGVGDVTSAQIAQNRPYRNEEDLRTKIPCLKNRNIDLSGLTYFPFGE